MLKLAIRTSALRYRRNCRSRIRQQQWGFDTECRTAQRFNVIYSAPRHEIEADGIDNQLHTVCFAYSIVRFRSLIQIELVLKAGAAPTFYR